jgi:hypothetical protein
MIKEKEKIFLLKEKERGYLSRFGEISRNM